MKKIVVISGYFNPLHKGHLEYLNHAKAIADKLIVIVNNDYQRELKGSKAFQGEDERVIIISNLKAVDEVVLSIDQDRTVCSTIRHISEKFGKDYDLAFANGGDQSNETIPEVLVCEELEIALIDGLGEKVISSFINYFS